MRTSVLNTVKQGQILGRMSSNYIDMKWGTKYNNRKYKIPNPPYLEKMLCLNIVICYHCREHIKLGDPYTRSGSGGGNGKITKYYHSSCFERMHY